MEQKSKVYLFLDEEPQPIAVLDTPITFALDTHKLVDGDHLLTIVSKDHTGKEGIRKIPFIVRNGPAIEVEGMKEGGVVDGIVNIMVNAYGKADQKDFLIIGSETPQSIPYWVWITVIMVIAWGLYYMVRYLPDAGV
ncbi:cytochrome C [Myroides sp. DF42-4-2]|uniref:cytochrome C n=1 Tax=unclassified Myroides TaxID=2642485 RepID=UPI002577DEA3|nr:cytochrome C [Myroides sp. DF42-4-2]MDM1408838.1 cytochrome C [Myroides sp. DF42-4-2]